MSQGFGMESADAKKRTPSVSKSTQVTDIGCIQESLVEHFGDIEDPRVERTKKHHSHYLAEISGTTFSRPRFKAYSNLSIEALSCSASSSSNKAAINPYWSASVIRPELLT